MRLILLGPPGSGKGTQGARLARRLKVPLISTGDMFRAHVKGGTELGLKVKGILDAGELVPDEIVVRMVRGRLGEPDVEKGFLLDGFPRTLRQAELLDGMLAEMRIGIDKVIELLVPDDEIVRRLGGRRVCPECGAVYHVESKPPQREGRCDRDGAELAQRDDDREEVVRRRLRVYAGQAAPLTGFYRSRGVLAPVDGSGSAERIFDRIAEAL